MTIVLNPTQWYPPSGQGYVTIVGLLSLVDNLGNYIVTNNSDYIVTNAVEVSGKYTTAWTPTGA